MKSNEIYIADEKMIGTHSKAVFHESNNTVYDEIEYLKQLTSDNVTISASADKKIYVFPKYINASTNDYLTIDTINKSIAIPNGMRFQRCDNLTISTHYNDLVLDYSTLTGTEIILYRDIKNSEWVVGSYYNPPIGDRDLYLVTSFSVNNPKLLTLNSNNIRVLANKIDEVIEMTTFGDSLTANAGWQETCITRLNQKIKINNLGIGGSTMADGNSGLFNPMCNRTSSIPVTTKVLTIMAGTNDVARCQIGSLSADGAFDKTTFIGAYESVIKDAYTINPNMIIIIITLPKKFNSDGTYVNSEPFKEATLKVASRYGIPCINIHDNLGINEYTKASLMTDNVHLRGDAPGRLGRMLAETLKHTL